MGFANDEAQQALPALIIGLGGSGAWTLVHIKQQLYETYGNQIPSNISLVSFDTTQNPTAQVGGQGSNRSAGFSSGAVNLDDREYGFLGGAVKRLVEDVANDKKVRDSQQRRYTHLHWLLADWYLGNFKESQFQLDSGAGMYRQFGRLALFRDVAAPANSRFYSLISGKLGALKAQAASARAMSVFIIGSITGGTGAGLFLDTAYLVRRIAKEAVGSQQVVIQGYFYLPEAFRGVLDSTNMSHAQPRSYGGLRELRRFLMTEDWKYGYPMHYHHRSDSETWHGNMTEKIYDAVYLVDGNRQNNPLNTVPLNEGSAASIADAIVGFVDPHVGNYQKEYVVNLPSLTNTIKANKGAMAFVGAIGTYSIILPIEQIAEKWAYQLAGDALQALIMPQRLDSDGFPVELTPFNAENNQSIHDEVERLMVRRQPVFNPLNPQEQLTPSDLWAKLWNMGNASRTDPHSQLGTLKSYDANAWLNILRPTRADSDNQMQAVIRDTESIIQASVFTYENLTPGNKVKPRKEDPDSSARRIDAESRRYLDRYLGAQLASGRRDRGLYTDALNRFADVQAQRFEAIMRWYIATALNSSDPRRDPVNAKKGKLAWTIAVLEEIRDILAKATQLITMLVNDTTSSHNRRQQAMQMLDNALQTMRREASEGRANPAYKAQEAYLNAIDQYMKVFQAELTRDAVNQVAIRMREFVDNTLTELYKWRDLLALHTNSLYAETLKGYRRLETERKRANDIACRYVIDDPEWENQRYQDYITKQNALESFMQGINWEVQARSLPNGQMGLEFNFWVTVSKPNESPYNEKTRSDGRGEWAKDNLRLFLSAARNFFATAREEESVLRYLEGWRFTNRPDLLGDELYKNSGALLSFSQQDAGMGDMIPTTYLIAYQNPNRPAEKTFMESVFNQLKAKSGRSSETRAQVSDRMQSCEDRFRLTVMNMVEVLPFDDIPPVKAAQEAYMQRNWEARQQYHLFSAEITAVEFEERIHRQLRQEKRMLQDRVSILLEDYETFREFLFLMSHGIIQVNRDTVDEVNVQFVYYLVYPSRDPMKQGQMEAVWLTEPSKDPSLLDAMAAYIFHGEDMGQRYHNQNYRYKIDYAAVKQFLLAARQEDTDARVKENKLDTYQVGLLNTMQSASEDMQAELYSLIVQHDMLRDLRDRLDKKLNGDIFSQLRVARQENEIKKTQILQELYDLYSVAVVALDEENNALKKDIEQRSTRGKSSTQNGKTLSGMGRNPSAST